MGLMDKVKAQANQLAQKTQDAAQEGRARIDQAQAVRRGDVLLRQLGALVFAERTGRGSPDSQARIDRLIGEISAHESQNGLNLADPTKAGSGQPAGGQAPGQPGQTGQEPPGQTGETGPAGQTGEQPPGQPGQGTVPPQGGEFRPPGGQPPAGGSDIPPVDTSTDFFPPPADNS